MNEMRAMIDETAEKIFRDLCTKELVDAAEKNEWPDALWNALEEAGLTHAAVPEALGGSGGSLGDAMAVLRQAGRYAAPLPLTETVIAGWLLGQASLAVPDGPLTVAFSAESEPIGSRVAWASRASRIVHLVRSDDRALIQQLSPNNCTIESGTNLAGEPREKLHVPSDATEAIALPAGFDVLRAWELGALCRSMQMAGAMETIVELTVEHANVREQFGRPIASFQAVRQQIAVMAGHAAAAAKAAEYAADRFDEADATLAIATAKARVGEAAGIVAETAHQVHGAIGITYEHALHQYTRRLWSWRDEYGGETHWQAVIGRQVAEAGADGIWPMIAGS
jgi:alkylation response protein AidB-like acyl-CoA dehydrogenase